MPFPMGFTVFHPLHGEGQVRQDLGDTVIVRFTTGLQELLASELQIRGTINLAQDDDRAIEVVTKALALSIRSVNDQWGVFGRSRIQLLPHQLWVCHRILQDWPNRWLIADDVGLGKTVEAGLAVLALTSRQMINRVLILCPASLCIQWQERLLRMFDLRFQIFYSTDAHREAAWDVSSQVIASLHTVRNYASGQNEDDPRLLAMLSAKSWDLIIVDEAHHLNHDETGGMTLGYRLVKKLDDEGQLKGMLLFTGTPHRGKDFSFLALLHLINPQAFSPYLGIDDQLRNLHSVMIRNNKQAVTDLDGKPLFQSVVVRPEEYAFSDSERVFYERMTLFILQGRAYADNLGMSARRTNHLVLTTLQKLASSSIAAVSQTLRKRLAKIDGAKRPVPAFHELEDMWSAPDPEQGDAANLVAEDVVSEANQLLVGESSYLSQLIELADGVTRETKIERIIAIAREMPHDEPLLIFTEFKTTQRAIFIRLSETFGDNSTAFLNGDGILRDMPLQYGGPEIHSAKDEAARQFNDGRKRFLICTEAGGEGIDLHHRCNAVVHADLPWNPMRLHQRNGRLYRLNQKRQVQVTLLRNSETLESRIWDLLEEKLQRVQRAYSGAMEAPDDIAQLVLGMAPAGTYERMQVESLGKSATEVASTVARATQFLDSQRALDTVLSIFGNCSRFDFGHSVKHLPKVDLPDLKPFLELALKRHQRLLKTSPDDAESFDFISPEAWAAQRGIRARYKGLHCDRHRPGKDALIHLLGAGHPIIDLALREAVDLPARSCKIGSGPDSLVIVQIQDRVTSGPQRTAIYAGILLSESRTHQFLHDWEIIHYLNGLSKRHRQWDKGDQQVDVIASHRITVDALLPDLIERVAQQRTLVKPEAQFALLIRGLSQAKQVGTGDADPVPLATVEGS